ncbi:hypothetical protein PLESTM_000847500 [Pleodorina starrii]|nr:hypothetical protein PLESTM_000847500 [Pleodorina starrii]
MMSQGPGWATSTSQTYQQDDSGGSGGMETAASNCHNEIIAAFRARDKEAVEERGGHLTALQLLPWLPLPAQQHPQHNDGASNSSSSDVSSGSDSSGSGGGAGDATSDLGRKLADMCCATMKRPTATAAPPNHSATAAAAATLALPPPLLPPKLRLQHLSEVCGAATAAIAAADGAVSAAASRRPAPAAPDTHPLGSGKPELQ